MIPQRLAKLRAGKHLRWSHMLCELGPLAVTEAVFWNDVPCCLVRSGYGSAELLIPNVDAGGGAQRIRAAGSARLMGMAAPPSADGIIIVHEHPEGACLVTVRANGEIVATRAHADSHYDVRVATDGKRIVTTTHEGPDLWWFDDWDLRRREPWSLEPLRGALGDVPLRALDVQNLGDAVMIATKGTWSRWSWEGRLLDAWRAPPDTSHRPYLVRWHDEAPLVYARPDDLAMDLAPSYRCHLIEWNLSRGLGRSLGEHRSWPVADRSADGRWLVADRVTPEGRGLELWNLRDGTLVERLDARRRAARAIAFAPNGKEVAIASIDDLFVLRIDESG